MQYETSTELLRRNAKPSEFFHNLPEDAARIGAERRLPSSDIPGQQGIPVPLASLGQLLEQVNQQDPPNPVRNVALILREMAIGSAQVGGKLDKSRKFQDGVEAALRLSRGQGDWGSKDIFREDMKAVGAALREGLRDMKAHEPDGDIRKSWLPSVEAEMKRFASNNGFPMSSGLVGAVAAGMNRGTSRQG